MSRTLEQERKYRKTKIGRASTLLKGYKREDKKRNRGECSLTIEDILQLWENGCHWCGETDWTKLGADRLDNSKPHTIDNVVCSCWKCNTERSLEILHSNLKMVYQFNKDKICIGCYENANIAAKENNLWQSNISKCCKGKLKTTGGYYWSYNETLI